MDIPTFQAKSLRNAKVAKASSVSRVIKPPLASIAPATSQDASAQATQQAEQDTSFSSSDANGNSGSLTYNDIATDFAFPKHFQKMDYYKPVFHSQSPYDFNQRYTFLNQLTRPGNTLDKASQVGSNSLFGKMPIIVLRIGDFIHTKAVVNSVNFDMNESTWDMNTEGMGMQPMFCKVTMDINVIGGMAMEFPVNRLQTATDHNLIANSTYYHDKHYSKSRWDYRKTIHEQEKDSPK